jgi:hypothetical protein
MRALRAAADFPLIIVDAGQRRAIVDAGQRRAGSVRRPSTKPASPRSLTTQGELTRSARELAAREIQTVSHVFQPDGRRWARTRVGSHFIEAWPLNDGLSGSISPVVTDNQSAFGGLTEGTNLRGATVP